MKIQYLLWLMFMITACHPNSVKSKIADTSKATVPYFNNLEQIDSIQKSKQHPLTKPEQELVKAEENEDEEDYSKQAKDLHYVNKYKTFIVFANGKKMRLSDYFKESDELDRKCNMPWGVPDSYGKLDFDHDGKDELLLTFIPSAGRWSTVSYYIFEPVAKNTFKFAAKFGKTSSSEDYREKDEFPLSMGGKLIGMFFTMDDTDNYPEVDQGNIPKLYGLSYGYKNYHFVLKNDHKQLTQDILINLKWMQKNSSCDTVTVQEEDKGKYIGNDNGFRRVFSYDIVSYYLMTKSFPKTKQLFYTYYPCTDKNRVWKELKATIKSLMENNTF